MAQLIELSIGLRCDHFQLPNVSRGEIITIYWECNKSFNPPCWCFRIADMRERAAERDAET
jgi:hypothetical protein